LKVLAAAHVAPGGPPDIAASLGPRVLASASFSSRPCSCWATGQRMKGSLRGPLGTRLPSHGHPTTLPCGALPSVPGTGTWGQRVVTERSPATRFTKAPPRPPSCPHPPQTRSPTWLSSGVPCNAAKPQTLLSPSSCCSLSMWSESGLQSTEVTEGSSFGSELLWHHGDALSLQQKQPSS